MVSAVAGAPSWGRACTVRPERLRANFHEAFDFSHPILLPAACSVSDVLRAPRSASEGSGVQPTI